MGRDLVGASAAGEHALGGLGSHRITLAALWATAAPAIATTSAVMAAPTNNRANLLVMRYSYLSVVRDGKVRKNTLRYVRQGSLTARQRIAHP